PRQDGDERVSGLAARRRHPRPPRRRSRQTGRPRRDRSARRAVGVITIEPAEDLSIVRELITEYANSLGVDLSFQDLDHELATLESFYELILLARDDKRVAGCVALRHIDDSICEMKRLYVRPTSRGHDLGRSLANRVI